MGGFLQQGVADLSSADGAIVDGDSSSIKASVFDYTNSNPVAVRLTDTNGDFTAAGAGTQYTEDDAAAANPIGTAQILIRADTPATITSADGDNVASRGSNYGAAYVTLLDTSGNEVSVGGGTQYDEDAASVGGEKLTLAGVVRQDSISSSTTTDGDYAYMKVNNVGRLYTSATIDAALPAGTNAIGKLAANSGVDIGDVDVTSIIPGTGATNLGKAEDAVHSSGDTGVMPLAVRNDVLAALAGTDGDYAPLQVNASGALYIQEGSALDVSGATVTVAGTGTFAVQEDGAALTALQLIDDIVKTDDAAFTPATDKVAMVGAEFDDATPDSVDEGDAGALRMSANRNLYVQLRDAAGNERGLNIDASGQIAVTVASGQSIAVTQATHDSLNANVNLQVSDTDVSSSNPVPTEEEGHGAIGTATKTVAVAGTSEQLASAACKRVTIQALHGNTGIVTVGDINVVAAEDSTQRGINLPQGFTIVLHVTNTNLVYVDALNNGDGVSYIYEN